MYTLGNYIFFPSKYCTEQYMEQNSPHGTVTMWSIRSFVSEMVYVYIYANVDQKKSHTHIRIYTYTNTVL